MAPQKKKGGIKWAKVSEVSAIAIVVILGVMQGISEIFGFIKTRRK